MVSLSFIKCCIALKVDRLNIDGLAGKHQKRQNFPLYGIYIIATEEY